MTSRVAGQGEPGFADLLRYRGRRLTAAAVVGAIGSIWTVYLAAFGVNPVISVLPTAASLAATLLADSSAILRLTSTAELYIVRLVARCSSKPFLAIALLAGYSVVLGLGFKPWRLSVSAILLGMLAGSAIARPMLRYAGEVLFAANVKGPSLPGAAVLLACIALPFAMSSAAVLFHSWQPFIGVLLCVYGARCLYSYSSCAVVWSVERAFPFEVVKPSQENGGLIKIVRWTEHSLNRSFIKRSLAGLALCYVVYWFAGSRHAGYRQEFRRLRVKRFYSQRRYAKVLELTHDDADGILLYLRAQSLIRLQCLDAADNLLNEAIQDSRSDLNPYLFLARAHFHLERLGFRSEAYRRDIDSASQLAEVRLGRGDRGGACPDAIAERAKIDAFDYAVALRRDGISPSEFPDALVSALKKANEARRTAERCGVRLASEMRGIEGMIHGLAGDYREAYPAFLDALTTGENLNARYHLGVLLMVGSVSFLRPIYHFERVLALAPAGSRLASLARARRDEALEASLLNVELASSWDLFKLVTFRQRQVEVCEDESTPIFHIALRDDNKKRAAYKSILRREPDDQFSKRVNAMMPQITEFPSSRIEEVDNEQIKKDVTILAVSP